MDVVVLIGAAVVLVFGFVVLFGAPYLPTLTPQVAAALDLAELKKGQHLLELGCGDGKVLLAAARRGVRVTGYELNPILALVSWVRTYRYRALVTVVWGDFWRHKLPPADAIFVFLLPKYMSKLDKKIMQETSKQCKLVSFAFVVPDRKIHAQKGGMYLYLY